MASSDRLTALAGSLLYGLLLAAAFVGNGTVCSAASPLPLAQPARSTAQTIVAGSVDLSAVIAFHPAMRNFDYRSGKFVSQTSVPGVSTGLQAWKETQSEQRRIRSMETAMEAQVRRVNDELIQNQSKTREGKKIDRPEFAKLARMNQEHKALLAPLANRILGGFPDQLLGSVPQQNLERIMSEVFWAVQTSAQAHGAAIVLNTSTGDFNPEGSTGQSSAKSASGDILERWNIRSLNDLEALLQTPGASMPFETARPKPSAELVCGGHFESVTDPNILKSLVCEFYDNRQSFSQPFLRMGATRHILSGSVQVTSLDLTSEAVSRLIELYRSRPAERDAIMNLLRERLGH
ncbi:MAG TPA: hypothetical protein PKM25_00700 [Candidatus Ozemobacteraceae bacterium]|nr:hypothetical protein [Candidatus Ozemobacteraceae bacterium]